MIARLELGRLASAASSALKIALTAFVAALVVSGCGPQSGPNAVGDAFTTRAPKRFKPIKDYRLKLENVSSDWTFTAGKTAWLTYRMKNLADKPLLILEWRAEKGDEALPAASAKKTTAREKDKNVMQLDDNDWERRENPNLRLYYALYDSVSKKPGEWKTYALETAPNDRRGALQLSPGNSTLMDIRLPFVENPAPDRPRHPVRYAVRAELNLESVKATSEKIVITVNP